MKPLKTCNYLPGGVLVNWSCDTMQLGVSLDIFIYDCIQSVVTYSLLLWEGVTSFEHPLDFLLSSFALSVTPFQFKDIVEEFSLEKH